MITVAGRRLKPLPKQLKKLLLWAGAVFVLFLLIVFGSHRCLSRANRKAEAPWRQIGRIAQRQLDLVSELASLAANPPPEFAKPLRLLRQTHRALEQQYEILTRSPSMTQNQLGDYERAYKAMTASVERILRTAPSPAASGAGGSQEWLGCYRGVQKLLRTEEARYNAFASSYNRLYEAFFLSWVAEKFHMQSRPLFRQSKTRHADG